MLASDAQVQQIVQNRVRPRCEQIRDLLLAMQDDKAVFDDVYSALNVQSPTWTDTSADHPPNLLVPGDLLAFNTFISDMITAINSNPELPIIRKACVRGV